MQFPVSIFVNMYNKLTESLELVEHGNRSQNVFPFTCLRKSESVKRAQINH